MSSCKFEGCTKPVEQKTHGLCAGHRHQMRRNGKLKPLYDTLPLLPKCTVKGCDRESRHKKVGLCYYHYNLKNQIRLANEDDRRCDVEGCRMKHYAKNLCWLHYNGNRLLMKRLELFGDIAA